MIDELHNQTQVDSLPNQTKEIDQKGIARQIRDTVVDIIQNIKPEIIQHADQSGFTLENPLPGSSDKPSLTYFNNLGEDVSTEVNVLVSPNLQPYRSISMNVLSTQLPRNDLPNRPVTSIFEFSHSVAPDPSALKLTISGTRDAPLVESDQPDSPTLLKQCLEFAQLVRQNLPDSHRKTTLVSQ